MKCTSVPCLRNRCPTILKSFIFYFSLFPVSTFCTGSFFGKTYNKYIPELIVILPKLLIAKTSVSQTEVRDLVPYIALLGTSCNLIYPPDLVFWEFFVLFCFCFKNSLFVPDYSLSPEMTYQWVWRYKPNYTGTIFCPSPAGQWHLSYPQT